MINVIEKTFAAVLPFVFAGVIIPAHCFARADIRFLDSAAVNDTAIYLGDIAVVNSEDRDFSERLAGVRVGRAAPPGHERMVNSVDVISYYLAAKYDPGSITALNQRRTRVRTRFRSHSVLEFEDKILAYLTDALGWHGSEWTVELDDKTIKCFDKPLKVTVEGLENPYAKGPEQLQLHLIQDNAVKQITVTCRIKVNAAVVVAAQPIERDQILTASDLSVRTVDITRMRYDPFRDPSFVVGMRAARTLREGVVLNRMVIREQPAVEKGDQVFIHVKSNAIRISLPARARESGKKGESIWVENLQTHKLVRVEVAGEGHVILPMKGAL